MGNTPSSSSSRTTTRDMPRPSASSRRRAAGNNRNRNNDTDLEVQQATALLAATMAAARPSIPSNLTSPSNTRPAPINRLSEVPVRNVLRYLDEHRDYFAVTAAFRNFNSIGRTPGAALDFALNKLYRVDRGDNRVRRSEYDIWDSFLRYELKLLFKSLHKSKCVLEGTQTPRAAPPSGDPFQGVYGTLDAMRYRQGSTQGTAPVTNFPDWPDILAYRLSDEVEFGSPEFRLQVMQLAARVHGERWAPDYPLLVRYGMATLDMRTLNGGDLVEQEDLKFPSFSGTAERERTVLSIAILRPFPRVVKILLPSRAPQRRPKALVARGADLNDVGGGGHGYALLISFVAALRDKTLLDEFLALGAIPNIPGREGEPLFVAVGATVLRDLDGVHMLMRDGFVLGPLRDATLLLAAYAKGAHVMVELFRHRSMQKDQDAINTALCIASLTLNQEAVHFLATLGADMNCRKAIDGGQFRSPLGWAMLASALPDRRDLPRLLGTIDLLVRFGADANDPAILDEFLVRPVTVSVELDPQPAAFVDVTRRRFRHLATGGSLYRQSLYEPLPPYPTTAEPDVNVESDYGTDEDDDDDDDDDVPLVKRLLTPEEKAYDEKEFKDTDAPWGTLFRALLVRGMDPYAWPEKRYFYHLKEWSPSTVKLFKDKRWKKRHEEKQGR
ncbi:hypothetical protein HDU89_003087 [Geranomyces variabilis]|nr:hypothetical protein HDU89_003087 [Geranomyces variabilis]